MANIYSNENFPLNVVRELRRLGHDVLTSLEAGQANKSIPDDKVLEFAKSKRRIFITHNRRDFIKLHKHGNCHAGIVVCPLDIDSKELANRVHIAMVEHNSIQGRLLRVNKENTRVE